MTKQQPRDLHAPPPPEPEQMAQPESPGRSDEAHDKPQGEGLGKPEQEGGTGDAYPDNTLPEPPDVIDNTLPDEPTPEQQDYQERSREVSEAIAEEYPEGLTSPTSSDVGKQTLTQADLGYDVTVEGVPPDAEAEVTPQHPSDPSAYEETKRNPGMAGSRSQADER